MSFVAETSAKTAAKHLYGSKKRVRMQTPSLIRESNKKARLEARSEAYTSSPNHQASPGQTFTESDNAIDDADEDPRDEIVMAIDMRNNDTIGCAYFVAAEETLYMSQDIKYGGLPVVEKFKQYIEPTAVIISSRADELLDNYFRYGPDGTVEDELASDRFRPPYFLEVRPGNEFNYDNAIRKLVDLDLDIYKTSQGTLLVPGDENPSHGYGRGLEPGLSHIQGNVVQLSSALDLESRLSLSCVNAILAFIERRRATVCLPGGQSHRDSSGITYLEMFGLEAVMTLNSDALISLQILSEDYHPHAHNQGPTNTASGSKQGLSVFGLFQNFARTPQGKRQLRQYFLRPSLDHKILDIRHEAIGVLLHPDNELTLRDLVKSLKNITNIRATVQGLKKGIGNGASDGGGTKSSVWFRLRSFAYYTIMIEQDVGKIKYADNLQIRDKIIESFDRRVLGTVGRAIMEIIDFSESNVSHRSVVLRGVDQTLDEMKRQYDGLEDMLNHVSREIGQTIPVEFAATLSIVFFPQIGFLIAMPVNPITETVDFQDPMWEQSFYTAEKMYFKDFRMTELDNTIGDIYADICDREIEIVHNLAQRVLQYADTLVRVSDVCAELDCLTALAQGARAYNLVRPVMTDDNVIDIQGGWHLLQALLVPACIANDLNLCGGPQKSSPPNPTGRRENSRSILPSLMLLTGPNYSGKSVYLKQNALIVYLAHVGSFVPASQATIGITDQILTRITTRETISKMQSAFLIDLQQISSAMYTMTRRTLLVIDEFGKGTNPADGVGLMCGLITYLLELGDNRPKVLVATHFHELFERKYLKNHPNLYLANMEIRLDKQAVELENQVTYLYNLLPGRSTSSFGTVCAAINGIDGNIVARAESLLAHQAQGTDLADLCCTSDSKDREEIKLAEEVARQLLLVDLDEEDVDLSKWLSTMLEETDTGSNSSPFVELKSSRGSIGGDPFLDHQDH